ncbi:MAG: hypothetical protein AAFW60_11790 [Pseudomonadota bacterium]
MMKVFSLIIASALALCLAAISGSYWFEELQGQPDWQMTVAIAASVFVSVMTFVSAYFIRSHGIGLALSVLIFFVADTYQNAHGWQTFKGLTVSEEVTAAEARVDKARAALDELPTPSATGAIRRIETWTTVNTTLTERLKKAETTLAELQRPEAPIERVAIAMGLIQIALAIFFACMGKAKETEPAEAEDIETESDVDQADDEKETGTVLRFIHRPKAMDNKDLKAWTAISK